MADDFSAILVPGDDVPMLEFRDRLIETTLFKPDQTTFEGSSAIGTTLDDLAHATGIEGRYNFAAGILALDGITNQWANTGVGYGACRFASEGEHPEGGGVFGNTAVGYLAMSVLVDAFDNSALGALALQNLRNGNDNTAVGIKSLTAFRDGDDNTSCGYGGFENLDSDAVGSGASSGNCGLGAQHGRFLSDATTPLTRAQNSIYIGNQAFAGPTNNPENEIVIGAGAVGMGSNTAVFGKDLTDVYFAAAELHATGGVNSNDGPITGGSISTHGSAGELVVRTRNTGADWQLYNNAGQLRFYDGGGDKITITSTTLTTSLDIEADSVRIVTSAPPATAGAAGLAGQIAWDAGFIYVCVATNTWKRVAIATW
jgi:hypothetical protein